MRIRIFPAGERALLVETGDVAGALALTAMLRRADLPALEDLIPAAETVLVRVAARTNVAELQARILDLSAHVGVEFDSDAAGHPVVIPVRYDGPDLPDVARATGLSIAEVIAAHSETVWRAAFVGFAPGFAYLTGGDRKLAVPRRTESRTTVPAGSVALAGGFSAVYPRRSPGGWQLIGSTDATLWNIDADPPASIQPGAWVRFVDVDAPNEDAPVDRASDTTDSSSGNGARDHHAGEPSSNGSTTAARTTAEARA